MKQWLFYPYRYHNRWLWWLTHRPRWWWHSATVSTRTPPKSPKPSPLTPSLEALIPPHRHNQRQRYNNLPSHSHFDPFHFHILLTKQQSTRAEYIIHRNGLTFSVAKVNRSRISTSWPIYFLSYHVATIITRKEASCGLPFFNWTHIKKLPEHSCLVVKEIYHFSMYSITSIIKPDGESSEKPSLCIHSMNFRVNDPTRIQYSSPCVHMQAYSGKHVTAYPAKTSWRLQTVTFKVYYSRIWLWSFTGGTGTFFRFIDLKAMRIQKLLLYLLVCNQDGLFRFR